MKKYIAYFRVSTKKKKCSGLGLQAQRTIISHYTKLDNAEIISEYTETESGKAMINRPQLQQVIS